MTDSQNPELFYKSKNPARTKSFDRKCVQVRGKGTFGSPVLVVISTVPCDRKRTVSLTGTGS